MSEAGAMMQRSPRIITVKDGIADPDVVYVEPEGTVRFDNQDPREYRVRLFTRDSTQHSDIDILVPAYGSATFMADPAVPEGEHNCDYQLIETNLADFKSKLAKSGGGTPVFPAGQNPAVAGRIVIGPSPKITGS
jgi:hypothetical protein